MSDEKIQDELEDLYDDLVDLGGSLSDFSDYVFDTQKKVKKLIDQISLEGE